MPITENLTIEYNIPEHIRTFITKAFCWQFVYELHRVFDISAEDAELDVVVNVESTSGWAVAFDTACRKTKNEELSKYYHTLPWYDSDIFDDKLADIMVEYKIIVPHDEWTEIARQNNVIADDVCFCGKCYQYYKANEVTQLEDGDPMAASDYICHSCNQTGKSTPLTYDRLKQIRHYLGEDVEVFKCSKCGKYHFVQNKGNEFCLFCETQQTPNTCVNEYYTEELKKQKEYKATLFSNIKVVDKSQRPHA